jgi:lysine/ornithine N-monooxygenase
LPLDSIENPEELITSHEYYNWKDDTKLQNTELGVPLLLDSVSFIENSKKFTKTSYLYLNDIQEILCNNTFITVEIRYNETNEKLANAIYKYFIKTGDIGKQGLYLKKTEIENPKVEIMFNYRMFFNDN